MMCDKSDILEQGEWQPATADELRAFAVRFVDQRCWGALVDDHNNGLCLIRLDFGKQYELRSPRKRYSPELVQHRFIGEHVLWRTYAPWRLDDLSDRTVLVTSYDSEEGSERIQLALEGLINKRITRIVFREPSFDCSIYFDELLRLKLFPAISTPGCPNYRLGSMGTLYSVNAYSSLLSKTVPLF